MLFLLCLLVAVPPIGAFWMMYQVIRYERHPFPLIVLAMFAPFVFSGTTSSEFGPVNTKRGRANPTGNFECNRLITSTTTRPYL